MINTENEALKRMKMCIGISSSKNITSAFKMMSDALEELEEYRAIGTVEELKSLKENGAFTGVELAQLAAMQMRLKEYSAIGTIDEFKALKEKNNCKDCAGCTVWKCDCSNIRNMAIDEFAENLIKELKEKAFNDFEEEYSENGDLLVWFDNVKEIVERMKGGAE